MRGEDASITDDWTRKKKVIERGRRDCTRTILIEEAGLGLNLIQELRADKPAGMPQPVAIRPQGDKRARMEAASAQFESGQVLFPDWGPWNDTLLHELLAFPHGRYDDQVDSISQFLNLRRTRFGRADGWIDTDEELGIAGEWAPNPFETRPKV